MKRGNFLIDILLLFIFTICTQAQDTLYIFAQGRCIQQIPASVIDSIDFGERALPATGTLTDLDGNTYNWVKIGEQKWMTENLKVKHYNNGDSIIEARDTLQWFSIGPGRCAYNFSNENAEKYGFIYNLESVKDPRRIAPEGWRIPTVDDWKKLQNYLIQNGFNYDGTLRGHKYGASLAGNEFWRESFKPGMIGNKDTPHNATLFNALPGGINIHQNKYINFNIIKNYDFKFQFLGTGAFWWAYDSSDLKRNIVSIWSGTNQLLNYQSFQSVECYVRCLKNE